MKKLLLILLCFPLFMQAQTSADLYADGWEDGWKDAYLSAGGIGMIDKTFTDYFDAQRDYTDPYQAGYNKGSKQGRSDAEKKKSNSNNVQNTSQNAQNSNQEAQLNNAYDAGQAVGAAIAASITKKKAKRAAEKELQKMEEGIRMIEPGLYVNISIGDKKSTFLTGIEERCRQEIKIESEVFDTDYEIIDTKTTKYNKGKLARVEITFRLLNTEGLIIGSTIEELKFMLRELKEFLDLGIFSEEEYNNNAEPFKKTLKILLKQKISNKINKKISKQPELLQPESELRIKKRVNQLKELLRKGSITQEEYDEAIQTLEELKNNRLTIE